MTISVSTERRIKDPKYGKTYRSTKKILAHDKIGEAKIGDKVEITECRPISKRKSYNLSKIIK